MPSEFAFRPDDESALVFLPDPATLHQLGILLLDGSGSMAEELVDATTGVRQQKAEIVDSVARSLIGRLARGRQAQSFFCAACRFAEEADTLLEICRVTEVPSDVRLMPLFAPHQGTFLGAGLELAERLLHQWFHVWDHGPLPTSAVLIVMSDGRDTDGTQRRPEETFAIADRLRRLPGLTICSTYFEAAEAETVEAVNTLKRIATNPTKHYCRTTSAEELRHFFLASFTVTPERPRS